MQPRLAALMYVCMQPRLAVCMHVCMYAYAPLVLAWWWYVNSLGHVRLSLWVSLWKFMEKRTNSAWLVCCAAIGAQMSVSVDYCASTHPEHSLSTRVSEALAASFLLRAGFETEIYGYILYLVFPFSGRGRSKCGARNYLWRLCLPSSGWSSRDLQLLMPSQGTKLLAMCCAILCSHKFVLLFLY